MGCCSSKKRTRSNSVIFKVTNIDYSGKEINHGQIEITDSDLIMHYARDKSSVSCPLKTVRRYGYEDFMFCFEAGRSSPFGEGIFAFRSKKAENIFKTIQERLQISEGINAARDMSAEVRFYAGRTRRQNNEQEEIYDEVSFNGLRSSNSSLQNIESPYMDLNPNNSFSPYANIPNACNDNNGSSHSSPIEEKITYTQVEIAVCNSKYKVLPNPPKVEVSDYAVINFEHTKGLRNMSKCPYIPGTQRTRHDYEPSTS